MGGHCVSVPVRAHVRVACGVWFVVEAQRYMPRWHGLGYRARVYHVTPYGSVLMPLTWSGQSGNRRA